MRIISRRALREFIALHPHSEPALRAWRTVIEHNHFGHWAALKAGFNSVDKVGELTVFNLGGNKYRLIAFIRFEAQILYVKAILTHREYDQGAWKL